MSGTEILLVPAVREPFGRTLIEAMLLGTPVVATDSGGNREAIVDEMNGFSGSSRRSQCIRGARVSSPGRLHFADANCRNREKGSACEI